MDVILSIHESKVRIGIHEVTNELFNLHEFTNSDSYFQEFMNEKSKIPLARTPHGGEGFIK